MDLKTFAVHRKLIHDDDLLSYVMKQQPVPIPVIEASFGGFIEELSDEKASSLITDYTRMLGEHVPVLIRRNEATGGYDISGDIPDSLVDAVSLVHNVQPDEIVKALVDYNLETVHGHSCKILNTSLQEHAERTRMSAESIPPVVSVREVEALDTPVPDREEFFASEPAEAVSTEPEDVYEAELSGTEPYGQELPPEELSYEESLDKPSDIQPDEGPKEKDFAKAIQNIYNRFCEDLRRHNLDTRLNLAM